MIIREGSVSRMRTAGSRKNNIRRHTLMCTVQLICSGISVLMLVASCASPSAKLPLPPPKYVYHTPEVEETKSANSLWRDSSNLFEDRKARRVNDLVTINIVESLSGSGTADTDTKRESTAEYDMTKFFGMNTDFNLQNAWLLKNMYKGANIFEPVVQGSGQSEFKGSGDTNREGSLDATITAKVVEVMPNGNLVLESRKELTINNEKQILVLSGVVRPDDISANNSIDSNLIADAKIYYVGDGVIQDKQSPGWLVRVLDHLWAF